MLWLVTFFSAWLVSGIVKSYFAPAPGAACYLVSLILVFLASELCFWLTRFLFGNRRRSFIYWLIAFVIYFLGSVFAAQGQHILTSMLFSAVVVLALDLFGRSLLSIVKEKRFEISGFVTLLVTGIFMGGIFYFMFAEGFGSSRIDVYRQMVENDTVNLEKFEEETKKGECEVTEFTYGVEDSCTISSITVDLSPFAERSGIGGWCMQRYFDYDLDEAPIAGKIWCPQDKKNCPVLFIVHGNHDYTTPSYLGYDYLGEYLASFGYVVVSVDENVCNDLADENDARAVLLLENIKQILKWNADSHHELYQKIDGEKIAIAGHSRGGEMVATAYYFNDLTNYPDNGEIAFDYHFPIQSVIAIAPCVDQYMPGDRAVTISDVNYLVLHGANDQDSAFLCLADFEEDADVKNGTMEQVTISTEGMDNWHEGRRVIGSGYDGENEQTALRPRVVLVDENNHQTVADSAATVFPTWKVQLQKLDILFQQYEYKHHFQTVIVEPEDFSAKDEDFDMEHVKEIRIEFSGEQDGDIQLDDIGLVQK